MELKRLGWRAALAVVTATLALAGCGESGDVGEGPAPPGTPQAYLLDAANHLRRIRLDTGSSVAGNITITGLQPSETILGIDFRPGSTFLYGLGSSGRLYTIDPTTGAATQVGANTFQGNLVGRVGFDFNPVVDRIRIVTDRFDNFRMDPTDASNNRDTDLAYDPAGPNANARPNVSAAAYTNNFAGAPNTTLYVLDADLNVLALQGGVGGNPSPNTGILTVVGPLGIDFTAGGFDIVPSTGTAFAVLEVAGESAPVLAAINLTNGSAQRVGRVNSASEVRGLAIIP